MVLTVVYLFMIFWAINMRHDSVWTFVQYFFLFTVLKLSSSGLGDLLALVFKKIEIVQQANSMIIVPMFLVSGFAANVMTIPWHMRVYSYLSFFRFGFQGAMDIEFDSTVRNEWIQNCRQLKENCNDKSNGNCYINYNQYPPNYPRPTSCDPKFTYNFYENTYGWNLLILAGQAVFFRILGLWATYYLVKERNLKQDEIPEDILPRIDNRQHMKYSLSARPIKKNNKVSDNVKQAAQVNEEKWPLNSVTPSPEPHLGPRAQDINQHPAKVNFFEVDPEPQA